MDKKDKKNDKPSRIANITSPKPAATPKKSSSLSPAMATWARSNRKMIEKSGTKKQRAMLAQLDKGKTKGVGPVKSGAEYARSLNKGKSTPLPKSARNPSTSSTPKAKPTVNTPVQTSKPKPDPQANKGKDDERTGTYGKSLPNNPQLKTQKPKPKTKPKQYKGGQRARVASQEDRNTASKKTLQGIKKTVSNVTSSLFNKEGDKKTVGRTQYIFQKGRWRKYTV